MKFIFKIVGLSLIFLLAILLIAGLFYPRKYFLEQSIFIQAPKEIVWKNISTFANYQKWNPWSELDPHMRYRVEEVDGIVGSIYHWEGNHRVGSGNIGYLTLKPMERAELGLALIKPLALESKM